MKKIISIIIAISMLLASVPAFAISGTGTEANPYLISSASDINKIHNDLDGYYKLTANIDMSGVAFEPIGNENEGAFTGTIDGAGYTISNLNINLPDNKYVGFVGYLEGMVKNLDFVNVDVCGYRYVGGLVGYAEDNSEVSNCSISGKITGIYQILKLYVGGITGYNCGTIKSCTNSSSVSDSTNKDDVYIGGIAGYNIGTITNCMNIGNVCVESSSYIGGIVGCNYGTITECINNGSVVSDSGTGGVGGIAGYNYGSVVNCTNNGNVGNGQGCGGITGYNYGKIINCINSGCINGYEYAGGIAGYSNNPIENCTNSGSISGRKSGGIVGYNVGKEHHVAKIVNCLNSGSVSGAEYAGGIAGGHVGSNNYGYSEIITSANSGCVNNSIYTGGIAGYDGNYSTITRCYYLSDTTSVNAEGEKLHFTEFLNFECFAGFDFEEVWEINPNINSGFPMLRSMPRHMVLNESIKLLQSGESASLCAYIDETTEIVTWSSDDNSVATISKDGTVIAKTIGNCTVTATNAEGKKANCLIYVYGKATSMELSNNEISMDKGKTYTLTTIQAPNTANESIRWYSENETIATVNQNGVVTAKAKGTTVVYGITAHSNIRAECIVNVSAPITSILLSSTSKTINLGNIDIITATLSPAAYEGSITWNSSDESIVTVDQNGKITAHKIGTAHITVTATSGVVAQCTITVIQPSASIKMNKTNITTYVNSTCQLSASMLPLDTTDTITWSSSSTSYATVSSTGLVTGKRVGTATITARTSSGLTATCYVTVKASPIAPTTITLSDTYITLAPEDAKALTATLLPSNATETTLTWTSSNNDVATVDRNGVVTAIGEGFATIKAKTTNGLSHECVVKVVSASGPSVIVDNVKSFPAGIAKTKVNIIRNPGISGYKFTINYDDTLLTPVSVTANEEFGGTLTTNLDDENRTEFNVVWYSNGDTDIDINGELFTIDFKVEETAELGDYSDISIEYGAKDICNTAGENIALYIESAKVTVEEPLAGDIYEDGDVNVYDLTLLARHMIGLADFTERQMEAANVTDDDLVDIKDVVKLAQYVVGWTGVELMSLMSLDADVPETPIVTVGTASVNEANEADIPVYIKNNTGVAAYRFVLDYNADDIEIVSITPSDFINPENFGTNLGQENNEGLIVFCYQEGDAVADGELFNVKVRYKNPTDTSVSPISIKSAENNFCNQTIENVAVNYETGYALGDDYIVANKVVGDTNFSCELYFDDSYAEQSAKAIIAFYDGDGRLVQLMPKDITVKPGKVDLSIDYDKKAYTTYKLMIWEGIGNLKPITEVK